MRESGDLFVRISKQIALLDFGAAQCVALHATHDRALHPAVLDCILRSIRRHHGAGGLEPPPIAPTILDLHELDPTDSGFRDSAEHHMRKLRGTPYLLADAKAQAFFVDLPKECWGDPLAT